MIITFAIIGVIYADETLSETGLSNETAELGGVLVSDENGPGNIRRQMRIDGYLREFEGDYEKRERFSELIAQKEESGVTIDDRELHNIYRAVKYEGAAAGEPVSASNNGGSPALRSNSSGVQSFGGLGTNSLTSAQESDSVYIDSAEFSLGYANPVEITELEPGFVWSGFDIINGYSNTMAVKAIVTLRNIVTNVMEDAAVLKNNIAAGSSETVTAGFNIPEDSANYAINIELWDLEMNKLCEYKFPERYAVMTVADGTDYLSVNVEAADVFSLKYNGIVETYESNGEYVSIEINEPVTTEFIITGDLTYFDIDGGITSFNNSGLSNLTFLDLSYNQLTSFSGAGLTNLLSLFLGSNSIATFDAADLGNLKLLWMDNNDLTEFNGTGLLNLDSLDLLCNKLTTFYGGFHYAGGLFLSYNQLTSFSDGGYGNVNCLILDNNQLTDISLCSSWDYDYTAIYLNDNPDLSSYTISTNELYNLSHLDLRNTALGNLGVINGVWNNLIFDLPVRNDYYYGALCVSNTALAVALTNALTTPINKYWYVSVD
jgi:Leucine-rich repeat (LRR) protein